MNLWFITPVYRRFELTAICLEQRARALRALDIEAHCVVIGDDENLAVAEGLGLDTVVHQNRFLGQKFNAGYKHALERGATHCMAIGSDSWLHESGLNQVDWNEHQGYGLVGLSSFHPLGEERIDLAVARASGFGVGMVYPAHALTRYPEGPCYPYKSDGCDSSTWARCGRGKLQFRFINLPPYSFTNFHSQGESVTDYGLVRTAHHRRFGKTSENVFGVLRGVFDDDLVDAIEALIASRVSAS